MRQYLPGAPQTAAVQRVNGPTFDPTFDGAPQLRPIADTPLQYVANSPTPIIGVSPNRYYAVRAGVWFTAPSLNGPWAVATSVPEVIYTIPPSSSLYYVTYVRVYGSTPKVVYVGYTLGYSELPGKSQCAGSKHRNPTERIDY